MDISQAIAKQRLSDKSVEDFEQWSGLIDEKNEVLDNILKFSRDNQARHLRNFFEKWNRFTCSNLQIRKLKYQSQIYQELLYYKYYFSFWRKRFTNRMTKNRSADLAICFYEMKTYKKVFKELNDSYLKKM